MNYKGTEYHSDTDGKDIKMMQEKRNGGTIKLREEGKFSEGAKQSTQHNKRR